MWRVISAVGAIFLGAAITLWELNAGSESPYDTWEISDKVAFDVAEATLRYQIENEVSGRKPKKAQWLVLAYGDLPSVEFAARFQEFPQIIKSYGEIDSDGDTVVFQIKSAERINDQTIAVCGKVTGGQDSKEKPLLGLNADKELTQYRVEHRDDVWEVVQATNP